MTRKKVKNQKKSDLKTTTQLPEQQSVDIKIIFEIKPPSNPDQPLFPMEKMPHVSRGKKVKDKSPGPPIEFDTNDI